MTIQKDRFPRVRRNILAIDGGGVRGLSSLLILQELMGYINAAVRNERHNEETDDKLEPHDVFDLVTGTSAGGLIAIMLGKLGMTLEECIDEFRNLSSTIFGKKQLRGRITHGLAPTKYSGTRLEHAIQDVIGKKGLNVQMPMFSNNNSDKVACAVICREHKDQSQYSEFIPGAVPVCSLLCYEQVTCFVSEAARATSAAPTFFPVQKIGRRYFVDGGMEYNNPSHAIFDHYTEPNRVAASRSVPKAFEEESISSCHGNLDLSLVRFVNLGTGTRSKALPPRQRDHLAQIFPGFIRMGIFLKRTLTEFAVNAQNTAESMKTLAWVSKGSHSVDLEYERFSADTGVCYFKMDEHKALDKIEALSREYLDRNETKEQLQKVGKEMATEYLQRHSKESVPNPTYSAQLKVPHSASPSPYTTPSRTTDAPEPGAETSASTSTAYEGLEGGVHKVNVDPKHSGDDHLTSSATRILSMEAN